MKKTAIYILFFINLLWLNCWMYSFSGVSFTNIKTATVHYFENKAAIVNPDLAPMLTEKLQQKIIRESPLKLVNDNGDVIFSGTITQYKVQPAAVQSGETALSNSLIVKVHLKFINNIDPTKSFEQDFKAEVLFDPNQNLADIEPQLIEEITDQLVDQIFLQAFSNW